MTLHRSARCRSRPRTACPGTRSVYNHMYSDGPYQISSYTPAKSLKFVRNPQWKASTDPMRKAYVNAININETGTQTTIYQEIRTSSPALGHDLGLAASRRPPTWAS